MIEVLLTILTLLTLIAVWALFQIKAKLAIDNNGPILREIKGLSENQGKVESLVKTEITTNRKEQADNAKALREEVGNNVKNLTDSITKSFGGLAGVQKEQLQSFGEQIKTLTTDHNSGQEKLRGLIDNSLKELREDNGKKLEEMRNTVDEKLQGTLEKRLAAAFNQVSERLDKVHKGLGEMQSLANGVGDLKKVLTNVKTRGVWGEYQAGNILEEILTPEQYLTNVSVRRGSQEVVEFAVKMPGSTEDSDDFVLLPIDSKFPQEDYHRLIAAQESADIEAVKTAAKSLENSIKREARTIRDKYVNPPRTTNFAVMFLPTESLYAEVLRQPGLAETIQREFRVMIAGPTTLAALLNSLSVGFRTLAIQKRSAEIWKLLGAVKTQFGTFSNLLENVQKKLNDASIAMDKAKKRSQMIERKLTKVEELPRDEAVALLPTSEIEEVK
jgi:DNA recombination protein RmuC